MKFDEFGLMKTVRGFFLELLLWCMRVLGNDRYQLLDGCLFKGDIMLRETREL